MSRIKTFERQQALRARLKERPLLHKAAEVDDVEALINLPVDWERVAALSLSADVAAAFDVPVQDPQTLLRDLQKAFDDNRVDHLLEKMQRDVIGAIAGPFGLGKVVSFYDKHGGNVDTIHNVRDGVYATEQEKAAYGHRGAYDADAVHKHADFIETNRQNSAARKNGGVADGYSGEVLKQNDHMDLDHIVSGKQTHDDPGRVLAEVATEEIANVKENLTPTDRSINRSKKAKDPEVFATHLEETAQARQKRIAELSQRQNTLTDQEQKELNKLTKLDGAKPDAIRRSAKKAKGAQDSKLNKAYYTSGKFIGSAAKTSLAEGRKMGTQQALGLLLTELFDGLMQEARDVFCHGLSEEKLFDDLRIRFNRVAKKVAARWQDALKAFFDGGLSGFLSNIITTIINALVTTSARIVRMIREGVFSLLSAVKIALFPPENLTTREACHEALKMLTAGGVMVLGVALEEVVEKVITSMPLLAPIAPMLATAIVGTTTAMAMAMAVYLVDKADLLGVIRQQRDAFILKSLDGEISANLECCLRLGEEVDKLLGDPTAVA